MNRRRFLRHSAEASAAALLLGCGSKAERAAEPPADRAPPEGAAPPPTPAKSAAADPPKAADPPPAATGGGELDGDFPEWNLGGESASPNTVLMFRGNPTHTFYGTGPIPDKPKLLWKQQL